MILTEGFLTASLDCHTAFADLVITDHATIFKSSFCAIFVHSALEFSFHDLFLCLRFKIIKLWGNIRVESHTFFLLIIDLRDKHSFALFSRWRHIVDRYVRDKVHELDLT